MRSHQHLPFLAVRRVDRIAQDRNPVWLGCSVEPLHNDSGRYASLIGRRIRLGQTQAHLLGHLLRVG